MPARNRAEVPAHQAFLEKREELSRLDLQGRFTHIFETNLWGANDSRSGTGSVDEQTAQLRAGLPLLLRELGAQSLLDLPCGDFAWMRQVPLPGIHYTGGDIVPELVARNERDFGMGAAGAGAASRTFRVLDLTRDPLPRVDVVFCRDCLVHLSFANIWKAIANLQRSGSTWLLTTTFPLHEENEDIEDGDWRMLHFERAPFCFPPAHRLLNEGCTEQDGKYGDKSLGLWRLADLPASPAA